MCILSDDLEVPLQLPPRHRAFELPAFPLARPDVMVDERRAQQIARFLRFGEAGGRLPEGGGERLSLRVVSVSPRLRPEPQLPLESLQGAPDPPPPGRVSASCRLPPPGLQPRLGPR